MVQQEFWRRLNSAGAFPRNRHKTSEQPFSTQLLQPYRLMHPANNEIQLKAQEHVGTHKIYFFHMSKVHKCISQSLMHTPTWLINQRLSERHPAVTPRGAGSHIPERLRSARTTFVRKPCISKCILPFFTLSVIIDLTEPRASIQASCIFHLQNNSDALRLFLCHHSRNKYISWSEVTSSFLV